MRSPRRLGWVFGWATIAMSSGGARVAWGSEPDPSLLELDWQAPPSCPDEASVRGQVDAYLGGPPEQALRAAGVIAPDGDGWRLTLDIEGAPKQFRARSCDDLGRAAALTLSIAIDPDAALREAAPPEPEPPPEPRPAPVPPRAAPPPAVVPAAPAERRDRKPVRASVRTEAGFHYGIAPGFQDVSLAIGLLWPRARLEIAGTWWLPGVAVQGADAQVSVMLGAVEARGCGTLKAWRFEFPLCGGLEFGAVRVSNSGTRHAFWSAVSASGALVWPFAHRFALWVGPEVVISTSRANTSVGGASYGVGPAAIRGFVGFEVRFP